MLPGSGVGIPLTVVSIAVIVWSRLWPEGGATLQSDSRNADVAEGTLLLSLIALPFMVFMLVRMIHGALLSRYVLATILGVVVAMACALSMGGRKAVTILALFAFCSQGMGEWRFWRHPTYDPLAQYSGPTSAEQLSYTAQFVQSAEYSNLPVVVSQEMLYLPLAYYSPRLVADRLVYLTDEKKESQNEGTDTMTKLTLGLEEFFPVQAKDYTEFITTHKEFLLYSESGPEWWLVDLTHQAASVQLLAVESNRQLFLVKMKEDSPR